MEYNNSLDAAVTGLMRTCYESKGGAQKVGNLNRWLKKYCFLGNVNAAFNKLPNVYKKNTDSITVCVKGKKQQE